MSESSRLAEDERGTDPQPRRLYRHPDDRMFGGVAGGLAAYLGVNTMVVRLGFVVASLLWLIGVVAYVAMWIVVPEAESGELIRERAPGISWPPHSWIGIGLIGLGAILLLNVTFWPAAFIAVGIALLAKGAQDEPQQPHVDRPAPYPPPSDPPADPDTRDVAASSSATTRPIAGSPAEPPPAPPADDIGGTPGRRPRRARSGLGQATLGLALAGAGALALLDAAGVLAPNPAQYVAVLLLVVGGGLLVGAWWGRARWLIAVGILLVPALFVTSFMPRIAPSPLGEQVVHASSILAVEPSYEHSAGTLHLDLRDVDFTGEEVSTAASLGAGEIRVFAPDGVAVEVHARVGMGRIVIHGEEGTRREGAGLEMRHTIPGDDGALVIDLDVGLGNIHVIRAPSER